jgi:dipeptidyl-peptidase-4
VLTGTAQKKAITLEALWSGAFRTERLDELHSMNNGTQYAVFEFDRAERSTNVVIYDYKTLKKVKTLVASAALPKLNYFTGYTFSKDEQYVLLETESASIYRYSSKALYYVYNVKTKALVQVANTQIQEPTFSPDGTKVAYALENNLYVFDITSGRTDQITFDGSVNKISNGIADWVYEEEFAFVRAFEWNASSTKIAYTQFNETNVPEFSMDVYGTGLYQTQQVFKYPKAGEQNSKVALYVFDIETNTTNPVVFNKAYDDNVYIPRIKWTNTGEILSVQVLNRAQNVLDLWFVNTNTGTTDVVLTETDAAYVEVKDDLTFLDDTSFLWTSEKDGFNHIYHYSKTGALIEQITKGRWEVTDFYGYNPKEQTVFYQSTENGTINRAVYTTKLNGRRKKCLTPKEGTNAADFSADFSVFINTFSSAKTPPEYTLHDAVTGALIKPIKNNTAFLEQLSTFDIAQKEFVTLAVNGNDLNMWLLKPTNFDATKTYPLLMHQYSGPGSQKVSNTWHSADDYWFQHLVQQGYIVACVDGRGTGYKGASFKKITQGNLGKYEVEDQIEAAKQLGAFPYIDASRIGIWGWSYGGFVSSNCLFKGNTVFKMAIAVAPVSSWRFYDTIYTERYLGLPQDNAVGYDDNSPISHVDGLKGDFLVVHGSADDNVHLQNTMRLVEALIQADKDFDWAIYPDKNHGIYGGNTRLHLYKKMTRFIHETLGDKRL